MATPNRKRSLDTDYIHQLCNQAPLVDPIRVAFLKRLSTFNILDWCGKPIDPPECAKYGWELAEKDVIKCSICRQYLSAELPTPSKYECYKEACRKLKERLISSHSKFCLFLLNPVSDQVMDIDQLTNSQLLSYVIEKANSCNQVDINIDFPKFKEVENIFEWLHDNHKLTSSLSSLTLAITGWTYTEDNHLACCEYCNRHWSLEEKLVQEAATSENVESVDPVNQHLSWCAWRKVSGWEARLTQLFQIKNSNSIQKRSRLSSLSYVSLTDGMRNVRQMLNGSF